MHTITTKERATIFNAMLESAGVSQWGRASRIVEACGVSNATASGWLNGSLPRDCVSLLKCCDVFDLDVYEWVTGVGRAKGVNTTKFKRNIEKVKSHENEHGSLSADRFSTLAIMLYEHEEKAEYLLDNMAIILPEK
jgi:transcriptional regulator with XRE-family HTH domain